MLQYFTFTLTCKYNAIFGDINAIYNTNNINKGIPHNYDCVQCGFISSKLLHLIYKIK